MHYQQLHILLLICPCHTNGQPTNTSIPTQRRHPNGFFPATETSRIPLFANFRRNAVCRTAHAYPDAWTCRRRADACAGRQVSLPEHWSSSGRDSPAPSIASTPSYRRSSWPGTCNLDKSQRLCPSLSTSTADPPSLRATDGRAVASVRSNCVTWSMRPNRCGVAN